MSVSSRNKSSGIAKTNFENCISCGQRVAVIFCHCGLFSSVVHAECTSLFHTCFCIQILKDPLLLIYFSSSSRSMAVEPFFFSLMTDRVLLWNNILPLNFFSCDQKDWQCSFIPMSPCVLTEEEMKNGTVMSSEEVIKFRKEGKLPAHLEDEKVVRLGTHNYREEPKGIREVFVRNINALFDRKREVDNAMISSDASSESTPKQLWNLDPATLEMVKNEILDGSSDLYHQWFIWGPGLMYMLRPNLRLRARLDQVIEDSVPKDFNPNKSIGIPIRGEHDDVEPNKRYIIF